MPVLRPLLPAIGALEEEDIMKAVFGATGKVGGKVAAMLLEAGIPVRILVRSEEKAAPLKNEGAEVVIGSLMNLDDIKKTMDRCDGAFLMTPVDYSSENYVDEEIQVGKNYAEALKDSSISHIAYLSVWKARERTGIPFYDTKAVIEDALISDDVDCTFLRPTNFMENLYSQWPLIKQYGIVSFPMPGDVPISMVATEDIAYVAAESLMRCGKGKVESYDILGPHDYTLIEATTIIGEAIAKPLRYQETPPDQIRPIFQNMGFSEAAIDGYIKYFAIMPKLKIDEDREKVYNEFNFEATTLETFIDTAAGALTVEA